MKKLLIGLVAIGAVVALRPVVKRTGHKMTEHCEQMASKCKEMMAAQKAAGVAPKPRERSEQEPPQYSGHPEPVGTA